MEQWYIFRGRENGFLSLLKYLFNNGSFGGQHSKYQGTSEIDQGDKGKYHQNLFRYDLRIFLL